MNKKIIGFGSPLIDYLVRENVEFVQKHSLVKNGMTLVNADTVNALINSVTAPAVVPGGSAANTICGLARMGIPSAFCGKIGKDPAADVLKTAYDRLGITQRFLTSDSTPTGKVLSIITPDSERTFATFLGSALELSENEITEELFKGCTHVYIEGYLIANPPLIVKIAQTAKKLGLTTAIDLASFNIILEHKNAFSDILKKFIDYVFTNEEEAQALTGETNPQKILDILIESCELAVLKLGKQGSMIRTKKEKITVPITPVKAVDTTGAGDLYAAGFLSGYLNGKDLKTCGTYGSITSKYVVQQYGAFMDDAAWKRILQECADAGKK